jgi:cytochrome c5
MSDRDFMKTFSGLLAALVALTVVIFVVAQMVAGNTNTKTKTAQADKQLAERIKPVGEVVLASAAAVANSVIPTANAAGNPGEGTYKQACGSCHDTGAAGAPKTGDKAAWGPRIAKGNDALYGVALKGKPGTAMLAKGGQAHLKDDAVKAAVDYMVGKSK